MAWQLRDNTRGRAGGGSENPGRRVGTNLRRCVKSRMVGQEGHGVLWARNAPPGPKTLWREVRRVVVRRVSSQSRMIRVRALSVSGASWHSGGGPAPASETGEAGGESPGPSRLKPSAKARAISSSTSSSQSTSANGLRFWSRFASPPALPADDLVTLDVDAREGALPAPTRFFGATPAPALAGGQHLKRIGVALVLCVSQSPLAGGCLWGPCHARRCGFGKGEAVVSFWFRSGTTI